MATFVFRRCLSCNIGSVIPDGEEIQASHKCKECGKVGNWSSVHRLKGHRLIATTDYGWSWENSGKGHYVSQLEDGPSTKRSKHAFVNSTREMKEKFARRDMKVVRDGF